MEPAAEGMGFVFIFAFLFWLVSEVSWHCEMYCQDCLKNNANAIKKASKMLSSSNRNADRQATRFLVEEELRADRVEPAD